MAACVLLGLLWAPAAWGQDTRAALNGKAIKVANAGDYDQAIQLLEEALSQGELNVTYLNLGRIYHKLGDCAKARDAYSSGLKAPAVPNPPQKVVQEALRGFIGELEGSCPGKVIVQCEPAEMTVTLESKGATPGATRPCGEEFELKPGEYTFQGKTSDGRAVASTVTVAPIDVTRVTLAIEEEPPGKLVVSCQDGAGVEVTIGDQRPSGCPASVELPAGTYAVLARREGADTWRGSVTLVPGDERRLTVPALSVQADEEDEGGDIRLALRYGAGFASLASGPLYDADDPSAEVDQFPTDGTQDELDGLQPGLLSHALEVEGVYALGVVDAGLLVWVQAPAFGFAVGPTVSKTFLSTDAVDLRARAYAAYGQLLQRVRSGDEEFVAEVGPIVLGGGVEASFPVSGAVAAVAGLHVQAGVPSTALLTYLSLGAEFSF